MNDSKITNKGVYTGLVLFGAYRFAVSIVFDVSVSDVSMVSDGHGREKELKLQ